MNDNSKLPTYGKALAELDRLREINAVMREALEIIAGNRQCLDNLMSNQDVARAAIARAEPQQT